MTTTRAERIEEYKQLIDSEIELLRSARETEQDANEWLRLDKAIDDLLISKDNAAAEIDAAISDTTPKDEGPLYFWGGEVCEYRPDSHLEGQYDEMNGDMEMPF